MSASESHLSNQISNTKLNIEKSNSLSIQNKLPERGSISQNELIKKNSFFSQRK